MARAKSAVLSPADKKAVIVDLKAKITGAKTAHKLQLGVVKAAVKNVVLGTKNVAVQEKLATTLGAALAKQVEALAAIQAPSMPSAAA